MTPEEQIKAFLTEAIQKLKASRPDLPTFLWDVQARAELSHGEEINYELSAYVAETERLKSDTLDGLLKLMQEHDPAEAARKSKQAKIEELQRELAELKKTTL